MVNPLHLNTVNKYLQRAPSLSRPSCELPLPHRAKSLILDILRLNRLESRFCSNHGPLSHSFQIFSWQDTGVGGYPFAQLPRRPAPEEVPV
jgi:hypothetical protein